MAAINSAAATRSSRRSMCGLFDRPSTRQSQPASRRFGFSLSQLTNGQDRPSVRQTRAIIIVAESGKRIIYNVICERGVD